MAFVTLFLATIVLAALKKQGILNKVPWWLILIPAVLAIMSEMGNY